MSPLCGAAGARQFRLAGDTDWLPVRTGFARGPNATELPLPGAYRTVARPLPWSPPPMSVKVPPMFPETEFDAVDTAEEVRIRRHFAGTVRSPHG